jgi:hypothetical protein
MGALSCPGLFILSFLSPCSPHPPEDGVSDATLPLVYRENCPSEVNRGPFGDGRPSRSSFSWLLFNPRWGECGTGDDNSTSRGIGMPVSRLCGLDDGYTFDGEVEV